MYEYVCLHRTLFMCAPQAFFNTNSELRWVAMATTAAKTFPTRDAHTFSRLLCNSIRGYLEMYASCMGRFALSLVSLKQRHRGGVDIDSRLAAAVSERARQTSVSKLNFSQWLHNELNL